MSTQHIRLEDLLGATGRSFESAQEELGLDEGMQTRLMFEDAEFEIKLQGLGMDAKNRLVFTPVSLSSLSGTGISAEAVSTIKVHYVATRPDPASESSPEKSRDEVVSEAAGRKDIQRLGDILGEMYYQAKYQPETKAWTVRVADSKDRTVRLLLINDKKT